MKKMVVMLCVSVMMISLTACSGEKKEEPVTAGTETTDVTGETPKEEPKEENKVEIVNERVLKYTDELNQPAALYLAELKNTGSHKMEISGVSIDLEDAGGSILNTTDMVTPYPNVINAGESAYI